MTDLTNTRPCYVYGLLDPGTATIFYIGTSFNPENRLTGHRSTRSGSSAGQRCREIIAAGRKPELVILHKCSSQNEALLIEHRLVSESPALANQARYLALRSTDDADSPEEPKPPNLQPGSYYSGFCARTKKARENMPQRLSTRQMADQLGVTYEAYLKYETRTALPHCLIPLFCDLTDITLGDLMYEAP